MMSVEKLLFPEVTPTAHRPPPGTAAMPESPVSPVPGFGLGTTDHVPLTPCRTSGKWVSELGSTAQPTAQVEPSADVAAANRSFSPEPLFGVLRIERLLGAPPATTVV
jgi:hypothetical protein